MPCHIESITHKFIWDLGGSSVFLKVLVFDHEQGNVVKAKEIKYRMDRISHYMFSVDLVGTFTFTSFYFSYRTYTSSSKG